MTTFAVDPVEVGAPLKTRPLGERFHNAVCLGGDPATPIVAFDSDELRHMDEVHPLIAAVSLAFANHRPLVLTPDAIWLTIAQGVAEHIREHAPALRSRLVRHAGTKEIELEVDEDLAPPTSANWSRMVDLLRAGLATEIGEGHARLFECTFSTSSATDLVASQVVLLDAYSPFFHYTMKLVCGIPQITLTGTPADWRTIEQRLDVVEELGLGAWCARLRPIIREMVATAEGRPNIALWKRIYNPRDAYGGEYVCGWITRFYPAVGASRSANPMLAFAMDEPKNVEPGFFKRMAERVRGRDPAYGLTLEQFPNRLSRVFVRVAIQMQHDRRVMLVGGLVAVAVDDAGALVPISGWHLTSEAHLDKVVRTIRERFTWAPVAKADFRASVFPPEELEELWFRAGAGPLFAGARAWRLFDRPDVRRVEIERGWSGGVVGGLPERRQLCYASGDDEVYWFTCTLTSADGRTRIVEPIDQVVTYGTSLATLLDTALATDGDIRSLAGDSLATVLATRLQRALARAAIRSGS